MLKRLPWLKLCGGCIDIYKKLQSGLFTIKLVVGPVCPQFNEADECKIDVALLALNQLHLQLTDVCKNLGQGKSKVCTFNSTTTLVGEGCCYLQSGTRRRNSHWNHNAPIHVPEGNQPQQREHSQSILTLSTTVTLTPQTMVSFHTRHICKVIFHGIQIQWASRKQPQNSKGCLVG